MTAHPPRRPLLRSLLNASLLGAALLLVVGGWATYEAWKVSRGTPRVTVNYRQRFREHVRESIDIPADRSEQAWSRLMDTLQESERVFRELEESISKSGFTPREEWDDGRLDFDRVHWFTLPDDIDRERRALSLLGQSGVFRRLAGFAEVAPGIPPTINEEAIYAKVLDKLAGTRALTKAGAAAMRLAVTDGDVERSAEFADHLLAVGQTASLQPMVIGWLVGASIHSLVHDELRHELTEGDFDEPTCARLLESLERRRLPSIELGLEGERALFHDFVQRTFSDDGAGDGYLAPGAMGGLPQDHMGGVPLDFVGGDSDGGFLDAFSARFFYGTRRATLRVYDRLVDGLIAESRLLPVDRWQGPFDPDAIVEGVGRRHFLVGLVAPPLQQVLKNDATFRVKAAGTRVMVALALHRARHGSYPSSLSALVPEILPEPPIDPLHGLPFGYRLVDDDPHGRSYLLYSTGCDRTDDGGRPLEFMGEPAPDQYRVLRDPSTAGSDFIINEPRWTE